MKALCKCNKQIESGFNKEKKFYYFWCPDCKIGGKGMTEKMAEKKFLETIASSQPSIDNLPVLASRDNFLSWVNSNNSALVASSASFVDKPETQRMIEKNAKYILKADLKKAWDTPEGRQSIVDAYGEALYFGATLPEMGSVVPFKDIVEFIPAVSAFQFALTSGKSAPFSEIHIDPLYENDQYDMSRNDGCFHFEIKKMGFPRGELIGVVVQAKDIESGKMIGEAYDEKRLMEKAKQHSVSYRYYLQDMELLKKAQAEGKDYIEKKAGWKLYAKDIDNPYANADKPEMLKKLADKSFLYPFMKVRNAKAIAGEWKEDDKSDTPITILNNSLDKIQQDIKDADFRIDDEPPAEQTQDNIKPEPEKKMSKGKQVTKEEKDLFGGDNL
jgi:hypothetical protein